MTHYALILAGGEGSRLKNTKIPKQFLEINKVPMLMHSVQAFKDADPNIKIYIGLQKKYHKTWELLCVKHNFNINHTLYLAGQERLNTVFEGLQRIYSDNETKNSIICIHDAARPFIHTQFIRDLLNSLKSTGIKAVIPIQKIKNSIVRSSKSTYFSTNRNNYLSCQTPQCYKFEAIFKAYNSIMNTELLDRNIKRQQLHDDLAVFYSLFRDKKHIVKFIDGLEQNIKITTNLDYFISEKYHQFLNKKDERF